MAERSPGYVLPNDQKLVFQLAFWGMPKHIHVSAASVDFRLNTAIGFTHLLNSEQQQRLCGWGRGSQSKK